jgi:uncharacterized LabA/DUF88 family protein
MQDEIALFIDFENIRYSLLNVQRREPDPQELIAIARRFGTVMVARAYADWSRQPEFFKGSLTAAMIDRVDCPAKVRERVRPTQSYYQQQGGYERQPWRDQGEAHDYSAYDAESEEEEDEEGVNERLDEERDLEESAEGVDEGAQDGLTDEEYGESADISDPAAGAHNGERRQDGFGYQNPSYYNGNGQAQQTSTIITQSTVDLNMLMDIIETVFDRPNINTFVLMTGDRDFTRICARLKLRLNKRVIVCGVPGTVSRDLISAAEQFIPLSYGAIAPSSGQYTGPTQAPMGPYTPGQGAYHRSYAAPAPTSYGNSQSYGNTFAPVEPDEPGFIQFLDYIDRHWSWRTIGGVANFIGDSYNPKNRFRGRLTRETARELLITCIEQDILEDEPDGMGNHNLRLNREHPKVATVLADLSLQ